MMSRSEHKGIRILTIICQCCLGLVFIFSGIVKGIDPTGTAIKIGEYLSSIGFSSHSGFDLPMAIVLCLYESLLGGLTLVGLYRRVIPRLMWLTMAVMTAITLYIVIADPVKDCGCFGDALIISNNATFAKNVILLVMATGLVYWRHYIHPLRVAVGQKAVIGIVMAVVIAQFIYSNMVHLPVIDFRPYKVGVSLPDATGRSASSADGGQYDYKFVYAKDGVEQTFTMDELSQVDSTWTFVRDETVEIKKGKVAPAADFIVTNLNGDDMTDSLILNGAHTFLMISPDLSVLDSTDVQAIHRLAVIGNKHGISTYLAYGVAGDDPTVVDRLQRDDAHLSVCRIDVTTAKTIIRSNPGLLIISDGTIVRKASVNDLKKLVNDPDFEAAPLSPMGDRRGLIIGRFAPMVVVALILGLGSLSMTISYRREEDKKRKQRTS